MKKLLLILFCLPLIGFGQDSESNDRVDRFFQNASVKEILELKLRITLNEIKSQENKLDSLRKDLFPSSEYLSKEDRIINLQQWISIDDAKKQVLENLIYSGREITAIERGNIFQSLLRSSIVIFSSVFIGSDYLEYHKIDKFSCRFYPSFGLAFTNVFALEILQDIYLETESYNKREIFNDRELDHIFGGIDITHKNKSKYQQYAWGYGDFSLYSIVKYTRYFLYFLVLFIVIRYFRKPLSTRIKNINLKTFFWVYPIIMVIGLPIFYLFVCLFEGDSPEFSEYIQVYDHSMAFFFHLLTLSPFLLFHLIWYIKMKLKNSNSK